MMEMNASTNTPDEEISEQSDLLGHAVGLAVFPDVKKEYNQHKHALKPKQLQYTIGEWTLGVIFIVIVAFIWTFSSVLVQYIFHTLDFQSTIFLTYVGISLFAVNLPLWYISNIIIPLIGMCWSGANATNATLSLRQKHEVLVHRSRFIENYHHVISLSGQVAPLWFLGNVAYNASLNWTSVTSSTVVSSTSTVFTFLFSTWLLKEEFHWIKVLGIILCMLGNIFTVFSDHTIETYDSNLHVFGDFVALFAAMMYGLYTTVIRKLIPTEEHVNIALFFGFIGVLSGVIGFPVILTLHWTNIEPLNGLTMQVMILLVIKGLLDNVLSDYLWARAVILTSPTVATVGLSLTVPFAILSDYMFHQLVPQDFTILAAVLVLLGFICINISTKNKDSNSAHKK